MKHEVSAAYAGKPGYVDLFCTCGEFWINVQQNAHVLAESHERVMNEHDERLENTGTCIHGGIQR